MRSYIGGSKACSFSQYNAGGMWLGCKWHRRNKKCYEVETSRQKCSEIEISGEKSSEVEISREKCSEVEISREKSQK